MLIKVEQLVSEHLRFIELMHLICCSITTRAEIKIVKLNVAHPRAFESLKNSRNEQVMHILQSKGQKHNKKIS